MAPRRSLQALNITERSRSVRTASSIRQAAARVSSIKPEPDSTPSTAAAVSGVRGWRAAPGSARSRARGPQGRAARVAPGRPRSARGAGRAPPARPAARTPPPPAPRPGGREGRGAAAGPGRPLAADPGRPGDRTRRAPRVGGEEVPGGHRHARRSPATSDSIPARRRETSAIATSTDSPLEKRSPATPAKPSQRRSSGAGPERRSSGGAAPASARSQKDRSSPSTRNSPGRVGQSARSTTRGSTMPFQRLLSRRKAMSWLSACAGARSGRRAEGHPARAGPAGGDQREAGVLTPLPHGRDPAEARRRNKQRGLWVAHAEGAKALDLLGQVEPEQASWHHRVHPLDSPQVPGASAAPAWAARAPGRARPHSPRARRPPPCGGRRNGAGAPGRRPAPRAGRRGRCSGPSRGRTRRRAR